MYKIFEESSVIVSGQRIIWNILQGSTNLCTIASNSQVHIHKPLLLPSYSMLHCLFLTFVFLKLYSLWPFPWLFTFPYQFRIFYNFRSFSCNMPTPFLQNRKREKKPKPKPKNNPTPNKQKKTMNKHNPSSLINNIQKRIKFCNQMHIRISSLIFRNPNLCPSSSYASGRLVETP